jgi:succinate dehydrogenase / fumarate reductase flavoprotein subunit
MWNYVGMGRNEQGLKFVLIKFTKSVTNLWHNLKIVGNDRMLIPVIEKALRVADFFGTRRTRSTRCTRKR